MNCKKKRLADSKEYVKILINLLLAIKKRDLIKKYIYMIQRRVSDLNMTDILPGETFYTTVLAYIDVNGIFAVT